MLYMYGLSILSFSLTLYLYLKTQMNDTLPQTSFFTIDTSRTMRYLLFLSILTAGASVVVTFFFSLIIMGIVFIVSVVFVLLIDLIIIIVSLILLLFGGGQLSLIDLGDLLGLGIFNIFLDVQEMLMGQAAMIYIAVLVAGLAVGSVLARYVEDIKSVFLVVLFQGSLLVTAWLTVAVQWRIPLLDFSRMSFDDYLPLILISEYLVSILLSAIPIYNRVHDDDLFDLVIFPDYLRYLLFVLYVPILVVPIYALVSTFTFFNDFFVSSTGEIEIGSFLVTIVGYGIVVFIALHNAYWGFLGDLPMDVKLGELEYRDELLEYAREFRDLDEDNIEEFANQTY